jgi:hypothetical protein
MRRMVPAVVSLVRSAPGGKVRRVGTGIDKAAVAVSANVNSVAVGARSRMTAVVEPGGGKSISGGSGGVESAVALNGVQVAGVRLDKVDSKVGAVVFKAMKAVPPEQRVVDSAENIVSSST